MRTNLFTPDTKQAVIEYQNGNPNFGNSVLDKSKRPSYMVDHKAGENLLSACDVGLVTGLTDYPMMLLSVKQLLTAARKESYKDIFIVDTKSSGVPPSLLEVGENGKMVMKRSAIALMIRVINLAHRERFYFIILDGTLVHAPEWFVGYRPDAIEDYVNQQLHSYFINKPTKSRFDGLMKRIKSLFKVFPHHFEEKSSKFSNV